MLFVTTLDEVFTIKIYDVLFHMLRYNESEKEETKTKESYIRKFTSKDTKGFTLNGTARIVIQWDIGKSFKKDVDNGKKESRMVDIES